MIGDPPIVPRRRGLGRVQAAPLRLARRPPRSSDFGRFFRPRLTTPAADAQIGAPKLRRTERIANKPIRFLSKKEEVALLASYAPHVRPIAETLCWQGLRIGEALRLDWRDVNWSGNGIFIADTKTGQTTVCLSTPQEFGLPSAQLWTTANRPSEGRVFLHRFGRPDADPRRYKLPGESPIRQAHRTACTCAGIANFRDLRSAASLGLPRVMAGIDLEPLCQEGGWKSL